MIGKKSVFRTLRFILFTVVTLVLILSAVMVTLLNWYQPAVKTYINGEFIGYFSSEQQFDEVYNDLVNEKQKIDSGVKVYLESEPTFEPSYIRDTLLAKQNIYTNLRAKIKTEYTIYDVAVNGEKKMTFSSQDDANKYANDLKKEVAKLTVEIKELKVAEFGEMTSVESANAILKDIVDRNQPVVPAKNTKTSKTKSNTSVSNAKVPDAVANEASSQGGVWPAATRSMSSYFGWRPEFGDFHTGLDLAGAAGTAIYAYKSGIVTFAGYASSYGNYIKIDHGNGMVTLYAHNSKLLVRAGEQVTQGQTISLMGRTGWATGNHLHFEVKVNGVTMNPYSYIQGK